MKVKELIKHLKKYDPEIEVGIKWLYPIAPIEEIGLVKLGKNFKKTKKEGRFEYVLISPFDVDINREY